MSELKQRKEQFVSGLAGGSIEEINLVTSVALCGYLCWNLLKNTTEDGNVNLIVDFFLNWCGLLLSITTYADNPIGLNLLILTPCVVYFFLKRTHSRQTRKRQMETSFELTKSPFITAYRGGMLIITALAILAVDFDIFPRRFAKVETWGTSLMDLGVGSFVFSNGIVSSRILLKEEMAQKRTGLFQRSFQALKAGGTIFALGLLRLFFVKNLEYQEHVTEYGVHWNFFITLALLPPTMVIIEPLSKHIPRILIATAISLAYEFVFLFKEEFRQFLILGSRKDLLSANREGVFSYLGYCAIFLWGQNTGFYILGNQKTKNNLYKPSVEVMPNKVKWSVWDRLTSVSPLSGLLIWTFIIFAFDQFVSSVHPYDVSRRFANLPYVLWIVSYNLGALSLYCLVDKLFGNKAPHYSVPLTLEAINSNGLALFLLANVSTGLVNMSISTIDSSPQTAFAVLLAYGSFLAVVSFVLYRKKIFIKL